MYFNSPLSSPVLTGETLCPAAVIDRRCTNYRLALHRNNTPSSASGLHTEKRKRRAAFSTRTAYHGTAVPKVARATS